MPYPKVQKRQRKISRKSATEFGLVWLAVSGHLWIILLHVKTVLCAFTDVPHRQFFNSVGVPMLNAKEL